MESEDVGHAVDDSFTAVYLVEFDSLVRLAALMLDSPAAAEDVVQDTFVRLYDRFGTVDSPQAWLRTAVTNACRNERRRLGTARRYAPRIARGPAAPTESVNELVESVRRLPFRQRAVVVLRYYLDLSEAEIASVLGIRPGTVKSSLHRALRRLRLEVNER